MANEEKKGGALAAFMGGSAGGALSDPKAVAQALLDAAGAGRSGDGEGTTYLSYSGKMRRYSMGRDKVQPDPDALYVVDPMSAIVGWTCWKGGSVAEKHEWSVYDSVSAVPASQLRDHGPYADDGDGWQFMMGISMFDIDEPGVPIKFSTTSKSGRNTLSDLTSEIGKRMVNGEPEIPVIRLADDVFVAHGKTNGKPLFPIEGWVTRPEVETFINMGDEGDLDDLLAGKYAVNILSPEDVPAADEAPAAPPAKKRRARRSAE